MSDRAFPAPDSVPATGEEPTAMPDAHTEVLEQPSAATSQAHQEEWADEFEALPPRPRRRLVTPLNAGLLGVLLVALGFIGGVLVEKGQGGGSAGTAGAARRGFAGGAAAAAAGGAGRAGAAAGAGAGVTVGTVSSVSGHTLYVTDAQGNTVRVRAASGAKVSRTSPVAVSAIHPGDTLIAQGATGSDGTLTATTLRATSPAAGGAGGALAGLFGGGRSGAGAGAGAAGGRTGAGAGAGAPAPGAGGPALFGSG
jgi:hypothetical protein